jgi:hypothetical protein
MATSSEYPRCDRILTSGLTVREDLAKSVMLAILAADASLSVHEERVAAMAVLQADELIRQLSKTVSS